MIGLSQEERLLAAKLHDAELTIKEHEQCNIRLLAENRKLKLRLESMEKDAARYRLARSRESRGSSDILIVHKIWGGDEIILCEEDADKAIDAAIQSSSAKS